MAKVLVIGSGGREQALAWKLAESSYVDKVFVAPGNGGSQGKIKNVDINFDDSRQLLKFATDNSIDLSVVGQEAASEAGVVDAFKQQRLTIFGPSKAAARIETSKTYSKDLMQTQHIPTAKYKNFSDAANAISYAKTRPKPVVIKADGLATGKGVIIAETDQQIDAAIKDIMINKRFGEAGDKVVVEDFLNGSEASLHALTDGNTSVIFPASQDHKQAYDGDEGPNTGGMGVIAPVDWISQKQLDNINRSVVLPALKGLKDSGATFVGCLYPGLMIDDDELKVLEYNARFGDPETEVYMRLLNCDLYNLLLDCARGQLKPDSIKWHDGFAVSIVLASEGYPGGYKKGLAITGVEAANSQPNIVVFHSGTEIKNADLFTNGGRVLNVTATGETLGQALDRAYAAVKLIHFDGMHYRKDIGRRTI